MSNFLAIASVTAVLRHVLSDAINHTGSGGVAGADVTTLRPDVHPMGGTDADPRLNLYLYEITPNAAGRNADLPTRTNAGQPRVRPAAALDLHYLLSCYGDEAAHEPQRLLGAATAALNARPVLSSGDFESAKRASGAPAFLTFSDLESEIHEVRVTSVGFTLEELSRLWSVLLQSKYVLSVGYRASVVFVESEAEVIPPRPVRQPFLTVLPFRRPTIEGVSAQPNAARPITDPCVILGGDTLILRGSGLGGPGARALLDDEEQSLVPNASETRVGLALSRSTLAGVHRLQIVQTSPLGTPPEPRRMFVSNVVMFAIQPLFTIDATNTASYTSNGVAVRDIDVHVDDIQPPIAPGQRVSLSLICPPSLDDTADPSQALPLQAYTVDVSLSPTGAPSGGYTSFAVHINGVFVGTYLSILQVDGAESPMYLAATGPAQGWQPALEVL